MLTQIRADSLSTASTHMTRGRARHCRRTPPLVAACLLALGSLAAQAPSYRLQAAAQPGGFLDSLIVGRPGLPFLTLIDASGGPTPMLGETIWLGLTAALSPIDAGALDGVGARTLRIGVPNTPSLAGITIYAQALMGDAASPNRLFRASNGESAALWRGSRAIVLRFDDPAAEGVTGTFDAAVKGRLQALPPRVRAVQAVDTVNGARFGQPLLNPLNPQGARLQAVLRARDLQATGEEEVLTAVRWRPFDGRLVADTFQRVAIAVSHSRVVPDFRLDPFSALPMFPFSGLARTFAQNAVDQPVFVYDGAYTLRPQDLRADGYVDYPRPQRHFAYNGVDSLLLDFYVMPSSATGANGHTVYLMVLSSSQPDARVFAAPGNPFQQTTATQGDNTMYDLQVELTRLKSVAVTPWIDIGTANQTFETPIAATAGPPGTRVVLRYRGAMDNRGTGATAWSTLVSAAHSSRFLQVEVTTEALLAGGTSSLDTLVLPIR
jgi:hypothetical protein